MTGSELFKFLAFEKEWQDRVDRLRAKKELSKEEIAETNILEDFVKKLDTLLHVLNP